MVHVVRFPPGSESLIHTSRQKVPFQDTNLVDIWL